MSQVIRLTENDIKQLVKNVLNEALEELTDVPGVLQRELQHQRILNKPSNDEPTDEWEIIASSLRKPDHSYPELYYTIRNKRTGERRNLSTFGAMSDPFNNWTMDGKYVKPNGVIVNGKPGPGNPCYDDADYLNNGGVSKHRQPRIHTK